MEEVFLGRQKFSPCEKIADLIKSYSANEVIAALLTRGKDTLVAECLQNGLVGPGTYGVLAAIGQGAPSIDSFAMRMKDGRLQMGLGRRLTGPAHAHGQWCFVGGGPARKPRFEAIVDHWKIDQGKDVHIPTAWKKFPMPYEYVPFGTAGIEGRDDGKWSYSMTVAAIILDDDDNFSPMTGPGGVELSKIEWFDNPPPDSTCAYNMGPCIRRCWERIHWMIDQKLLKFYPNTRNFAID